MRMFHVHVTAVVIVFQFFLCEAEERIGASGDAVADTETTHSPCDNFYMYACPKERRTKGITQKYLREQLHKKIQGILEDNTPEGRSSPDADLKSIKEQAKKLYEICLKDADKTETAKNRDALLHILQNFGIQNWPASSDQKKKDYKKILKGTGLRPLTTLNVVPVKELGNYIVKMNLLVPRFAPRPQVMKEIKHKKHREQYISYTAFIRTVIDLFFDRAGNRAAPKERLNEPSLEREDAEDNTIVEAIEDIIDVEKELAKMSLDPGPQAEYILKSAKEWQDIFGNQFPFMAALEKDFQRAGTGLLDNTMVGIHNQEYFQKLHKYLRKLETRKLLNYLGWYCIRAMADVLTIDVREKLSNFLQKASRPPVPVTFTKSVCIEKLIGNEGIMPVGITHLYLKKYFDSTFISKVSTVVPSLNTTFYEVIEDNNWMDDQTRATMRKWVTSLEYQMGAPSDLLGEQYVQEKYSLVKAPEENSVVLYFFQYRENDFLQSIKLSGQLYSRKKLWTVSPLDTAGRYSELQTMLEIPAAALQTPIFTLEELESKTYGSLGSLTAETMAFALLDEGRLWIRRRGDYEWTPTTKQNFQNAIKCLKIQDTEPKEPKKTPQDRFDRGGGEVRLGRKFYDHFSLRASYRAFMRSVTETAADKAGVSSTENAKKFFEAYAQRYCGCDATREDEYRVNFAMKTFSAFWQAFSCEEGTKMRAEDTCKIMSKSEYSTEISG